MDEAEERDYVAECAMRMADGEWWTVNRLRKPKDQGGIGAAPDAVKDALTDERFESAAGKRKDSTVYRLKQASRPPGDARDASPSLPEGEQASPSPPRERAIGGDACSGRNAPGEDAEVER